MFISIGPAGSPVQSPNVGNTLATNRVLQPSSEPACQTPRINSPVPTVTDVPEAQDLKSNLISVFCLFY